MEYPVQRGSLATAANMMGDQAASVLINGEQLVLTEVEITARSQRQVSAALPYLLEEQLAVAPESLHIASCASETKNHYQVAIIDRQLLTNIVTQITDQGIRLIGLYADSQALPATESTTVLIGDERALVRQTDGLGFAAALPVAAVLLQQGTVQTSGTTPNGKISCYCADSNHDSTSQFFHTMNIDPDECRAIAQPLELLARGLEPDRAINLLQGDFKPFTTAPPVKFPVITSLLLTLLLALFTAGQWLEKNDQRSQLQELNTLMDHTYRRHFGVPAPTVNFRQDLTGRLAARPLPARPTADFINQFGKLLPHFPSELRVDRIEYADSRLELTLRAADLTTATQLREKLRAANIIHSIQITERQKHQVLLRLTVGNDG